MVDLAALKEEALTKISASDSLDGLEQIRVAYLGKSGTISEQMKQIATLPAEDRKSFGANVNAVKQAVNDAIQTTAS